MLKRQSSKWKFEFTDPNQILEFILIYSIKKTEKFTGLNKVLLVLGQRAGAYREDWKILISINSFWLTLNLAIALYIKH